MAYTCISMRVQCKTTEINENSVLSTPLKRQLGPDSRQTTPSNRISLKSEKVPLSPHANSGAKTAPNLNHFHRKLSAFVFFSPLKNFRTKTLKSPVARSEPNCT